MKILYISISFSLESSNLYNDLVDKLLLRGHTITIISSNLKKDEQSHNPSLRLLKVHTGNQFSKNLFNKAIHMIFLEKLFIHNIKTKLTNQEFDLILFATPPITLDGVVRYSKQRFHAKTFLMLKDIFPQNAVDLQLFKKNSIVYKYFRKKEKKLYDISDYIGCISKKNIKYMKEHNHNLINKLHLFYNSIEIKQFEKCYVDRDAVTFIFGGNLGKPQYIEGLLLVIKELATFPIAQFIIMGKGSEASKVLNFIKRNEPNNLKFYEHTKRETYDEMLKMADVGIINLNPHFTIPNIPSKLLSYMNMKMPVVAFTDDYTDLKDIIEQAECGWWCNSFDVNGMVQTVKQICLHKDLIKLKGLNGYNYLQHTFDVLNNVLQIEQFMCNK